MNQWLRARAMEKVAKELTQEGREHIKPKNFAIPKGDGPGDTGKYPIHDEEHARNALTRVDQHGTPDEKRKVYDAVAEKYPGLAARSSVPEVREELMKDKENCGGMKMAAMRETLISIYGHKLAGAEQLAHAIEHPSGARGAWEAFRGEAPSALGATVGAVGAGYLGMNPLVGAGLGYGVGALPEAIGGIREWLAKRGGKVR